MKRNRMNPEQIRAECREAGVTAEVAEMVVMHHCEGKSWAEIAVQAEIKPASVRDSVGRAGRRLLRYREAARTPEDDDSLRDDAETIYECLRGPHRSAPLTPPVPAEGDRGRVKATVLTMGDVIQVCRLADERRGRRRNVQVIA